ncbi:hypothetical protein [Halorubrum tebenquichense]|nr:hypothetical protein [Halorubrum tebenquichense]
MSNRITGGDFRQLIGESRHDAVFASFDYDGAFPVNEQIDAVVET